MRLWVLGGLCLLSWLEEARCQSQKSAAARTDYVETLIARADQLELHSDKRWLRLLHYRPRSFAGGYRSEADGHRFFLAARGRTDPRAELHATLRSLFSPPVQELRVGRAGPARHPICRFPARLFVLQKALAIDVRRLPRQACPRFRNYLADLNPTSASVVFSSYYLNNPASAFGHTFIRFNKQAPLSTAERRELLDYAIEFSATVDTRNPVLYAVKGIFGLFPGSIHRLPYFYKVREYADAETRDVWDYELDLAPEHLYILAAHIWELGHTHFAYYYLDENCSYRINMILEAARPDVELTRGLTVPVLPADTLKALFRNPGLVRKVGYRPSLRTQFLHDVEGLSARQKDLVVRIARQPDTPLPSDQDKDQRAAILDAAAAYIDMRHIKDLVFKRDSNAAQRKQRVLERRAAIHRRSHSVPVQPPMDEQPHLGHDSRRLGLSAGVRSAGEGVLEGPFTAIDLRLAMHDLADPGVGYPELSAIEFLPARLRIWPHKGQPIVALDRLSLVRITSLNPLTRFDTRLSWRADVGARTLENEGCVRCLAGHAAVGGGLTAAFSEDALALFALMDTTLLAAGEPVGVFDSVFRLGAGPHVGIRARLADSLVALVEGEWLLFPEQPRPHLWQADAILRWGLARNLSVGLEGRLRADRHESQLFLLGYL